MVTSESGRLLRSPLLSAAGVRHGFTTRNGGCSTGRYASLNLGASWGDDPALVAANVDLLAQEGGFSTAALCQVVQVHGDLVLTLRAPERRQREADGMASAAPLCLAVLSADCVGVLLADGEGRVAAAHAGWRGTVADIAGAAVRALVALGARAERIRAAMGPSIGPCCFAVQEDVAAPFERLAPDVVRRTGAQPHVDLYAANRALLVAAGVRPQHIEARPPCSMCEPHRFFSYRRDGAQIGQQLAYIIGGPA